MRIHHIINTTPASSVTRHQSFTHTITWTRGDQIPTTTIGGVASNIVINTVEDTRYPISSLLVSPSSFVADFDTSGNLILSGYHYKVGYANHMFDYKAIGNFNKIDT